MTASGSPGPDTFWLTSDSLQLSESPLARLLPPKPDGTRRKFGLVDLQAQGNVVFEGEHPKKGAFTLRGQTATFDQAKYLFILQGDAATPATVTYQQTVGGPQQPQPAKAFYYWLKTKNFRVVDPAKVSFESIFD
jgi:hypothetical protein